MALPKDPGEIAESNIRSQNNLAQGQPTEFADNPNIQLASGFGSSKLLNLFKSGNKEGIFDIINSVLKGTKVSETIGDNSLQPSRIPTTQERGIVPDKGEYSERKAKELLSQSIMTPEGFEQFKKQNFKATSLEDLAAQEDALKALDDTELQIAEDLQTMKGVKQQASTALNRQRRGANIQVGESYDITSPKSEQFFEELKKGASDLKTKGTDFNFENIETEEDVLKAIEATSQVFKGETNLFKRGEMSHEETKYKAVNLLQDEIGITAKILKRREGEGFSAEMMVAARELLANSAKKLLTLANKIENGTATDVDKLKFRRQMAVHSAIQMQVKGAQTEIARALNSFKIPVGNFDEAEMGKLVNLAMEGHSDNVTKSLAKGLIKANNIGGLASVNRLSQDGWYAKSRRVVHELFLTSILSGPATQFRNFFGNATYIMYQYPSELLGGIYGDTLRAINPGLKANLTEDQMYTKDVLVRVHGQIGSFADAWVAAKHAFVTGMPTRGTKIEVEDMAAIKSMDESTRFGQGINWLGKVIRTPFSLLLAADEWFKTISTRGELNVKAHHRYRHSLNQGKTHEEAVANAQMVLLDPVSFATDLETTALHNTMQSDLGFLGKATRAVQNTWLGRFIIPFSVAPTNSIINAAENMPYLQMFHPKFMANLLGKNGAAAHQNAVGKIGLATGMATYVGEMVSRGRMTGGYPNDKRERENLPPGWMPYSFVFKGEDFPEGKPLYDEYGRPNGKLTYVSYMGMEPVGGVFGVTANAYQEYYKGLTASDGLLERHADFMHAMIVSVAPYLEEMPMLQGLADTIDVLERGKDADDWGFLKGIAEGPAENFPFIFSGLSRSINRAIDPTTMDARGQLSNFYTIGDITQVINPDQPNNRFLFTLPNGQPDYSKVGTPKQAEGTFAKTLESMEYYGTHLVQLTEKNRIQPVSAVASVWKDRDELVAPRYDTMGNVMGAENVSLSANPILSILSMLSGLRIQPGEEPSKPLLEVMRLQSVLPGEAWPFSNPKQKDGVKLTKGIISDWMALAKSEEFGITIRTPNGSVTFKQYLEDLLRPTSKIGEKYDRANDYQKLSMIRKADKDFKEAAWEQLLRQPEYSELRKLFANLDEAKRRIIGNTPQ
tara:strand:- start:3325 stop:6699 length:3375 start_codon:yes stop_codon:yes gene_type:complete